MNTKPLRARLAAALTAALTLTTIVAAPFVEAASPGINKVLDAGKQTGRNPDGTFATGRNVVYTVAVSCFDDGGNPTCSTFQLSDPPPTFTDVDGNPAQMTFISANAGATALTVHPGPVIEFNTPLNAGQSVNVDLVYQIPAWITPDNTTFTNTATWGPAGDTITSDPVNVTARARAAWTTSKTGPTTVTINTDATYQVAVCATNPTNPEFGPLRATLAGATLVDTLPATPAGLDLIVVDTGGGTHDPGAGTNGTVTWDLGDLTLTGGCATRNVTLRFETATPLASNVLVSNTVNAAGTPDVTEYDFNTTAVLPITVRNPLPGDPQLTKSVTRSVVDMDHTDGEADSTFSWTVRPRNVGQGVITDFTLTDTFNEHFALQSARPGTWPAGPTGPDGDNQVRFTFTRKSGATVIHHANGASNTTWTFPDIGDPVVAVTVEYGDVPASWNHSSGNQITFTGIAVNPGHDGHTWDLVANQTATLPNTATLSGDTVDVLGNHSSITRNATANVTVVAPQPAPAISKSASVVDGPTFGGAAYPTSTIRWTVTVTNPSATATGPMIDPSIYDLVPNLTGPGLDAPTNFTVTKPATLTLDDPLTQNVTSTTGTSGSQQLLVWDFTGEFRPGQTITVSFDTVVRDYTPPQTATNRAWVGTNAMDENAGEWYSTFTSGSGTWETDHEDLDGDGTTTERIRRANAQMNVNDFVVATSQKLVSGPELDPIDPCPLLPGGDDNTTFGTGRCTRAGDRLDYELTVVNEGNVGLEDLVLIDLFPSPGDRLVLPNQSNGSVAGRGPGGVGSDFAPNLTGPVTSSDPNVSVEYTTVDNPCRGGDFYPTIPAAVSWPPGCTPADWSPTLPVPITAVRGIRVTYDATLAVNNSFTFTWPMRAPVSAEPGQIAYNAFAWVASSADSDAINQSAPPVVAVEVNSEPKPWLIGDKVWVDTDYDGIQDAGETGGITGIPLAVFFDNDDSGTFTPGIDTLVASTITDTGANAGEYLFNNLVDGRYFVAAASPTSWVTSPQHAGVNPAADSNFEPLGKLGDTITPADLDGWDPAALNPAEFSWVWVSAPVEIDGDNDLSVDLGVWRPDPSIAVKKYTNTFDADLAPGVYIPVGQTVVWSYQVTNTGNTALDDLDLIDTTTSGAPVAVTVTCNTTTLEPGETTDCFGSVTPAAAAGNYGNTVAATAQPVLPTIGWPADTYANLVNVDGSDFWDGGNPANGPTPVSSTDTSHYYGADPQISLTKTINGNDANTAPGVFVPAGDPVQWQFTVANTGNVALVIDELADDQLGSFNSSQPCPAGTLSFPVTLQPGQSRTCRINGTATMYQHQNTGSVAGLPVDNNGDPIRNFDANGVPTGTTLDPVVAIDTAHYYGYATPSVDVEKHTSGYSPTGTAVAAVDADTAPGPTLGAGLPVTWHYTITNTGNVDLAIGELVDDQLGSIDDTTLTCETGTAAFPMVLTPDASVTCTMSDIAAIGSYANTATVAGWSLDEHGIPIDTQLTPDSPLIAELVMPVFDSDMSHYSGATAADLVVVKETSGDSWHLATGQLGHTAPADDIQLTAGGDVVWHYTVTNGGAVDLVDIELDDNHGTASAADDMTITVDGAGDISTAGIAGTATFTGDTGDDGVLSVGETWTFTIESTSTLGSYANSVTVTGQPVDINGDPVTDLTGTPVPRIGDTDTSSYIATTPPAILLDKTTNGLDAAAAPGPYVRDGEQITWTFDVTNTGSTALVDVEVTDPAIDASDPVCEIAVILPGHTASCDVPGYRFGVGQQTNTATVAGLPAAPTTPVHPTDTTLWPTSRGSYIVFTDGGDPVDAVTDTDTSHHYGAEPAITIDKTTNGETPAGYDDLTVPVGQSVAWTYTVTNTGNTTIADIVVTDTVDGAGTPITVICPTDELDPADQMTCTASGAATPGDYSNTAEVTGQPVDPDGTPAGDPVGDTDRSYHYGADPSVDITKTVNGDPADTAPGVFAPVGDTITWAFEVTNTGNVDLFIDELTDDQLGSFNSSRPCPAGTLTFPTTLEPGQSRTCSITGTAELYQHRNTVSVDALPVDAAGDPIRNFDANGDPTGTTMAPVADSDDGHYYGYALPSVDVTKTVSGTAPDGSPVGPDPADTAPGVELLAGTPVTWHYQIANTGNVTLQIGQLADDQLGNIDDVTLSCETGDATFPLLLDPGAAVTCTLSGIVQHADYVNVASVVGVPLDAGGDPIVTQLTPTSPADEVVVGLVTDDDAAHYSGVGGPAISVNKTTSGDSWHNATAEVTVVGPDDGIQLTAGGAVTWHYDVTNIGDVDLITVGIFDDHATADTDDDMIAVVAPPGPFAGTVFTTVDETAVTFTGDTGDDAVLSVGETWTFTITATSELGAYENLVFASGQPADVNGNPIVDGNGDDVDRVDADDTSSYAATAPPAIDVENAINGDDADAAPGPHLRASDTAEWAFVVTNTGGTALIDVTVTDPAVTVGGLVCEFELLLPGASETCQITGERLGAGDQAHTTTAVGTPAAPTVAVDPLDIDTWPTDPVEYVTFTELGDPVAAVTDSDDAHHYGADPAISLDKRTDGVDAATADDAAVVTPGADVIWTFEVANTGNITLDSIELADTADGHTVDVACPSAVLQPGDMMVCEMTGVAGTASHTNTAVVTGWAVDPDGSTLGEPVEATDTSHYRPAVADLEVTKQVTAGVDRDGYLTGDQVTWTIEVTNHGPDPAAVLQLTDRLPAELTYLAHGGDWACTPVFGGDLECGYDGTLAVGDTLVLTVDTAVHATAGVIVNTVEVSSASIDAVAANNLTGARALIPDPPERPTPTTTTPTTTPPPDRDGALPRTGSDVRQQLAATITLVIVGAGLWVISRVRRPRRS